MKVKLFPIIIILFFLLSSCLPDEAKKRKQQTEEKEKMDSLFMNGMVTVTMHTDTSVVINKKKK